MTAPHARYVVGFLFSHDTRDVLLIRKTHPQWQAGKLNGVGGKVESGEDLKTAMQREFFEETDMLLDHWTHFLTLTVNDFSTTPVPEANYIEVAFFYGRCTSRIPQPRTMPAGEEQPVIVDSTALDSSVMVYNLSWIIPLAISHIESPRFYIEAIEHGFASSSQQEAT